MKTLLLINILAFIAATGLYVKGERDAFPMFVTAASAIFCSIGLKD